MFDIHAAESEVRSELEAQVRDRILTRLNDAKTVALLRLEEIKQELNLIDQEIAARTPEIQG